MQEFIFLSPHTPLPIDGLLIGRTKLLSYVLVPSFSFIVLSFSHRKGGSRLLHQSLTYFKVGTSPASTSIIVVLPEGI